jgi:hypothetical protein
MRHTHVEELKNIAKKFTDTIMCSTGNNYETYVKQALDILTPEEKSQLLFLCMTTVIELGLDTRYPNHTAVSMSLSIVKELNQMYARINKKGTLVKALSFVLLNPDLDKET